MAMSLRYAKDDLERAAKPARRNAGLFWLAAALFGVMVYALTFLILA